FVLEDYDDQYEFVLFGEDYLKYKYFLQVNMMVGLRVLFSERIFKDREGNVTGKRLYVNVTKMQLMTEMLEKPTSKLLLNVNLRDLTGEVYNNLAQKLDKHRGDKSVVFIINAPETNNQLSMAGNIKVSINKELLKEI